MPTSGFGADNDDDDDAQASSSSAPASQGTGSGFMPNAGLGFAAVFGSVFLGFAVLL
jgi:hypothetical protein